MNKAQSLYIGAYLFLHSKMRSVSTKACYCQTQNFVCTIVLNKDQINRLLAITDCPIYVPEETLPYIYLPYIR